MSLWKEFHYITSNIEWLASPLVNFLLQDLKFLLLLHTNTQTKTGLEQVCQLEDSKRG